jgi:hypothetical protein
MCDYSLENVASRPAVVGERLITRSFPTSVTRGFVEIGDPSTAVCLRPGTEVAFDRPPKYNRALPFWSTTAAGKVARFRQVNLANPRTHHDALEFADGTIVLVAKLRRGQLATVLQLPTSLDQCDKTSQEVLENTVMATS